MDINIAEILEIDGIDYVTLDVITYKDIRYMFVDRLDENTEPVAEYSVFKIVNDNAFMIEDEMELNELLPMFSKNISKILEEFRSELIDNE